MYGLWIIAIGCAVALVAGIVLYCVARHNCWSDDAELAGIVVTFLASIAFSIFFILAIVMPVMADVEFKEFENTREIVSRTVENGADYENFAIRQTIIEANDWYITAETSKEKFGNWSKYCKIDFDNVEPITIGRRYENIESIP